MPLHCAWPLMYQMVFAHIWVHNQFGDISVATVLNNLILKESNQSNNSYCNKQELATCSI